ncbi:MAG TPA: ABC transporter permease [Anaerolineae bacterium]|nr:ABC transporter permease [Anaerolineae bacterium]HQI87315.1 ABC transporter permease [Anaerolineae bacterium]
MKRQKPLAATNDEQNETQESLKLEVASQWQLMWWKFRKHKLAMISGALVIAFYLVALFCEFLAPSVTTSYRDTYATAPPQPVHLFYEGKWLPHVKGLKYERDPVSLRKTWAIDQEIIVPIGFFVRGDPYKLWGLIPSDIHLIGAKNPGDPFYLLGADIIGRDVLSRLIYSSRVSLTVGLVGMVIALTIGILLGGISGLVGGALDNIIQRAIEILMSIPTLPVWLALAAVVPIDWPALRVYFMISIILSLVSWTGMARVVRSKFLALREEDFVMAAMLDGCGQTRLILRHMLPSFLSHIIASITLWIPGLILGETALSFLGLGLRPPVVSWGVMLQDTQKVAVIARYPWLLAPGGAVFLIVLTLNFLGDGLRDAADPY